MGKFDTHKMASGEIALVLEPRTKWRQFPKYIAKGIGKLNARVLNEPVISAYECLIELRIDGDGFWITYDKFQRAIHLEPQDKKYTDVVLQLQNKLRKNT